VNFLAKRGSIEPGSELFGKAFENWCFHELNAYNMYKERFADFFYWRLAGGTEVDFIVNDMRIAIEAKASGKISANHLKGLRSLQRDHPGIGRRIVVCCEDKPRVTEDGIEIIPAANFVEMLWAGVFF
jgi:predicted AAA+ superfamily ATPase